MPASHRPADPVMAPEEAALADLTPADVDLLFAEEIAAHAARLSAASERNRLWHAARVARLGLVPEDRSPQRQRAEAAEAAKEANAEAWLHTSTEIFGARTPALSASGREDADHRAKSVTVYEGDRLGQDPLSREISNGTMHTRHPEGEQHPASCGECFLIASDPAHLAHRAS